MQKGSKRAGDTAQCQGIYGLCSCRSYFISQYTAQCLVGLLALLYRKYARCLAPQCQGANVHGLGAGQYDPCIDNEVQAYFNRQDVQAALHANSSENALPYGPWMGCSTIVQYSQCACACPAAPASVFCVLMGGLWGKGK